MIKAGSYYRIDHSFTANGGGAFVNAYSLQVDFKINSKGQWRSFFQTSPENTGDGDFFINPAGNIGVAAVGYSSYEVIPQKWYRLLISVKNGTHFTVYLDGILLFTGNPQSIDGRFSLENQLLLFADDDAEDQDIVCAEAAVWNQALNAEQARELGGFGNYNGPNLMTRIPYIQQKGTEDITISWHDTATIETRVEYGTDASLGKTAKGTSEIISGPYQWHTSHLKELKPNTRYFYKVGNGENMSDLYSFRTLPDLKNSEKLRFLLLSDTHSSDTTMAIRVIRKARQKIESLYGPDIENHLTGVIHSGDIVVNGNTPDQYTSQFFGPVAPLSPYIPFWVVAGNHEQESPFFYQYLKLKNHSAFPDMHGLSEKIWNFTTGGALFVGLNSNIARNFGETQADWLDNRLSEAESDTNIRFAFIFIHHFPYSEIWDVTDDRTNYVRDFILPVLDKYPKVQMLHYGHTHGYERGTIAQGKSSYRIVCGGGGGGFVDPWNVANNHDYQNIHVSLNHHFFQILEIDPENESFECTMYSLGNKDYPMKVEKTDFWYRKPAQDPPKKPEIKSIEYQNEKWVIESSVFQGIDSLMSVQIQMLDSTDNGTILTDSIFHLVNIFGINSKNVPVNLNQGINPYEIIIKNLDRPGKPSPSFRIRYRDHNLIWSAWSETKIPETTGNHHEVLFHGNYGQIRNHPNPFRTNTTITYSLAEPGPVRITIYNANQQLFLEFHEDINNTGLNQYNFSGVNLSPGTYFLRLTTQHTVWKTKMVKVD